MADISDRIFGAIKAYVREILSDYTYTKDWEYAVTAYDAAAQTADLSPVNNQDLPPLKGIPIRLPNLQSVLKLSDTVVVRFIEANPAKPYIASYPTASNYTAALAVGRQGDMISIPVILVPAMAGQPPVPVPNPQSQRSCRLS